MRTLAHEINSLTSLSLTTIFAISKSNFDCKAYSLSHTFEYKSTKERSPTAFPTQLASFQVRLTEQSKSKPMHIYFFFIYNKRRPLPSNSLTPFKHPPFPPQVTKTDATKLRNSTFSHTKESCAKDELPGSIAKEIFVQFSPTANSNSPVVQIGFHDLSAPTWEDTTPKDCGRLTPGRQCPLPDIVRLWARAYRTCNHCGLKNTVTQVCCGLHKTSNRVKLFQNFWIMRNFFIGIKQLFLN